MTMKEAVVALLTGAQSTYTAAQLQAILIEEAGRWFKLASLSSLLKKLVDHGTLARDENFGPRGGYGYHMRNT